MSTLEARIAEVLEEHTLHMLTMATDDANGEWIVECNCDIPPISADGFFDGEQKFAAHQAAMLAPVIRDAQAEALEDYFKSVERVDECIHGLVEPDDAWLDFREAHNEFAHEYVPLAPLSEVTNAVYYAKYRADQIRSNDE